MRVFVTEHNSKEQINSVLNYTKNLNNLRIGVDTSIGRGASLSVKTIEFIVGNLNTLSLSEAIFLSPLIYKKIKDLPKTYLSLLEDLSDLCSWINRTTKNKPHVILDLDAMLSLGLNNLYLGGINEYETISVVVHKYNALESCFEVIHFENLCDLHLTENEVLDSALDCQYVLLSTSEVLVYISASGNVDKINL